MTDMRRLLHGLAYLGRTGHPAAAPAATSGLPPWLTMSAYMRAFLRDGAWESINRDVGGMAWS